MTGIRFTVGSGKNRVTFDRAPLHTAKWDEQKVGFRLSMGMPAHGNGHVASGVAKKA